MKGKKAEAVALIASLVQIIEVAKHYLAHGRPTRAVRLLRQVALQVEVRP